MLVHDRIREARAFYSAILHNQSGIISVVNIYIYIYNFQDNSSHGKIIWLLQLRSCRNSHKGGLLHDEICQFNGFVLRAISKLATGGSSPLSSEFKYWLECTHGITETIRTNSCWVAIDMHNLISRNSKP